MKRVTKEIVKILLPVIFISYLGVISFYTHVHIVNGIAIVHSHPFKKAATGDPVHSHTQAGFQLIKSVTTFSLTADAFVRPEIQAACFDIRKLQNSAFRLSYIPVATGISYLRAPPCQL